jgi:hypothetical protein
MTTKNDSVPGRPQRSAQSRILAVARVAAALLVFSSARSGAALAASTHTITVPAGTKIAILADEEISSGSAKKGDVFGFTAANDLIVNGYIIVKKGAHGEGLVSSAEPSGSHGHAGRLGLQFDYIYAVDGAKIKLTDVPTTSEGEQRKGASSTATIIGAATLGVGGLFAHNFVHGRDSVVRLGQTLSTYTGNAVHIRSDQTPLADNGYAR